MGNIYVPAASAEDWRFLLAEPEKHWRTGYSARALAHCWQAAHGFPRSVRRLFSRSAVPALLGELEMLLGIPEHRVPLPGGRRASQTDLFVLARGSDGLVCIGVEGKVEEPFGPLVTEWLVGASPGKLTRLRFLAGILGLSEEALPGLRYQLLHRSTSVLLEARRFGAGHAVMLVHSFSATDAGFEDYAAFGRALGGDPAPGRLTATNVTQPASLYLGWARGEREFLAA